MRLAVQKQLVEIPDDYEDRKQEYIDKVNQLEIIKNRDINLEEYKQAYLLYAQNDDDANLKIFMNSLASMY